MTMTSKEISQARFEPKHDMETYWLRELCLQMAELRELLLRIANKFGM